MGPDAMRREFLQRRRVTGRVLSVPSTASGADPYSGALASAGWAKRRSRTVGLRSTVEPT